MHTGYWGENQTIGDHSGKPRSIWEDNIKMDVKEVALEGMDWIDLARDTYK